MLGRAGAAWALAGSVAAGLAAVPAAACGLALAIGMDVSASIDEREHRLQRDGLASALVDPDVVESFLAVPGRARLQVYEWSGRGRQTVILDWMPVESADDLVTAAAVVQGAARSDRDFPTALGAALAFASLQFERAGCGDRMVNLSGDGENNDGLLPRVAIREFGLEETTVNALVVGGNVGRLRRYFEEQVIHGPGSFVEVALRFEDFADAMRRKLLRELGPLAALSDG